MIAFEQSFFTIKISFCKLAIHSGERFTLFFRGVKIIARLDCLLEKSVFI